MERRSGFFSNFGKAILLDIALFVIAMSLFIFFALSTLALAYIFAICIVVSICFAFVAHRRFRARSVQK